VSHQILAAQLETVRDLVAFELWATHAISIDVAHPYRLVSGRYSPIYVDCRRLISSVVFQDIFVLAARMVCSAHDVSFDVAAGGETAGIPFAAFAARAFRVPMIYVRKESKAHGLGTRIEGSLTSGAKVLLIEDLITDAGSKLSFIQAIQDAGGVVSGVLVVFDRLQGGREALAAKGIQLHALSDMESILRQGGALRVLSPKDLAAVRQYLESPETWQGDHNIPT